MGREFLFDNRPGRWALLNDKSIKAAPNDVDVLIVLGTGHDWQADLTPDDYALLSHSRLRRRYGFDVLVAEDRSELYLKYVRFYSQSRELPHATKGVLRIKL